MAAKLFTITANRTDDGAVAYVDRVGAGFTTRLEEAFRSSDEDRCGSVLAWARSQEQEVCDPYLLQVQDGPDGLSPLSARERIRAEGPEVTLARLGYDQGDTRTAVGGG